MRTLNDCAEGFRAEIQALAAVAGMTPDQVFGLWQEYARRCSMGDQSAVMFEFIQWYAADMGGNQAALQDAVREVA